jgi:microcystin-dependent protein
MRRGVLAGALALAAHAQATTITDNAGGGQPVSTVQPSLAINFIVATNGVYPPSGEPVPAESDTAGTTPYLGEIRMFAGDFLPAGYAAANGDILPISSRTTLYSLFGTTFGGNGQTTFALPDLRGRTAIGAGDSSSASPLGVANGQAAVTLASSSLPSHAHGLSTGSSGPVGGGQGFENRQPSLPVAVFVAAAPSLFTAENVGQIRMFGYTNRFTNFNAPTLSSFDYPLLFEQIGTSYGGDGLPDFQLPDLRGRTIVGSGQGPGLGSRSITQTGGTTDSVLSLSNMPPHAHTFPSGPTASTGGGAPVSNLQPHLVLDYFICIFGAFPFADGAGTEGPFIGEIRAFSITGGTPPDPDRWLPADGRILSTAPYNALFSVIGAAYGGNGTTTFALPDLRGRVPVGAGSGSTPSYTLGQQVGTENLSLSVSNLPPHTHSLPQASISLPTVTNITPTNALLGGNVTSDGGAAIAERGVVLSLSTVNTNPQIGGAGVTKLALAGTTGVFTTSAALTPGSSYVFAAYASNGAGPVYTTNRSFTAPTEIEQWRQTWFGSTNNSGAGADLADPYGRGVKNLLVFGLIGPTQNPATVRASQLPQWQLVGNDYRCTFVTPAGVGPVSYSAQFSFTMAPGSWGNLSNLGSGGTNIFSIPALGREKLFLRLRVVR